MWITFTQRHKVAQGDGKGPVYELGKSYEFRGGVAETYARKYIARGFAVEGRADAVKARPEPVAIEFATVDGKAVIVNPWPQRAVIASELLKKPLDGMQVTKNRVEFAVANGSAIYQIEKKQADDKATVLELVEQVYEALPANPT